MIGKLFLTQWIYIILSMTSINSYVFFAANLDDFRSIAKKIIPGQLADQLADMASKNPPDSPPDYETEHLKNEYNDNNEDEDNKEDKDKNNYEDSDYSEDKAIISNDQVDKHKETGDHDSDESDLETYKPLFIKSKPSIPRKRYVIKNQRIDNENIGKMNIDELVERVKDKLAKEFKIATTDHTEKTTDVTLESVKKIEDYYYKDDKLNGDLTKDDEYDNLNKLTTIMQVFTTERQHDSVFDLNEDAMKFKDVDKYQDKTVKEAVKFIAYNPKISYNDEDNIKDVIEYDEGNVKDIVYDSKLNVRDMNLNNENLNQLGDYEGTYIKDIPEYYEDEGKSGVQNNNENVHKLVSDNNENGKKMSKLYTKDDQGIYEDHVRVIQNNKEVEHNSENVKEVPVYDGSSIKNVPAYYEDNEKEIVQIELESVKEENQDDAKEENQDDIKEENQDGVKDVPEYYEDDQKDTQPAANTGDLFKEVNMLKKSNDSYEDYVTPKRDDIFESVEEQTRKPIKAKNIQKFAAANNFKFKLNKPKAIVDPVIKKKLINYVPMASLPVPVVSQPPKKLIKKKPEEIKGKTENLWYKDANIENYDESTKKTTAGVGSTKRKGLNTMFPTRAHFKMSSPNYYAKLPAVAEKYNFNEPLPEKDREPENLKHFGNPPAKINKKVKI